jgi:hypothetical protein
LKASKTSSCLKTGDTISCPEINIAITKITFIRLCGLFLGNSAQRILFTQTEKNSVHPFIATTNQILPRINRTRNRRDITEDDEVKTTFMPASLIQGQFFMGFGENKSLFLNPNDA